MDDLTNIGIKQVLITIGILVFGMTSKTLFACSCIGETTVAGAYNISEIVVCGQVISTTNEYLPDSASIKEMFQRLIIFGKQPV